MRATVTAVTSLHGPVTFPTDFAKLYLDCGHYTMVPREDEEALSFLGAEFDCDKPHGAVAECYRNFRVSVR